MSEWNRERIKAINVVDSSNATVSAVSHLRVFCAMIHLKTSQQVRRDEAKVARNTWAKRCDGFLFWDEKSEDEAAAFNRASIAEELSIPDTTPKDRWLRALRMWRHIIKSHVDHFDWFVAFDYSGFPIVENIRYVIRVASDFVDVQEPLFLSDVSLPRWGYILNQAAARNLSALIHDRSTLARSPTQLAQCPEPSRAETSQLAEEYTTMQRCLVHGLGVRHLTIQENEAVREALGCVRTTLQIVVTVLSMKETSHIACERAIFIYMIARPDWMLDIYQAVYKPQ